MVQIVVGGKSSRTRKHALRDPKYTLTDLLLEARCEETSKAQAADIEEHLESQALNTFTNVKREKTNKICFNCGGDYPHVENRVLQGTKHAIIAENKIILPVNIEAVIEASFQIKNP